MRDRSQFGPLMGVDTVDGRTVLGKRLGAIAAVAWIVVCAADPVQAQLFAPVAGPGGFYIGAEGGWTHLDTATNTGECQGGCIPRFPGDEAVSHERFNDGFNVGGRIGYQAGPWRVEGDFAYRRNSTAHLQMVSPQNRPGRSFNAERHATSQMANVIYDFGVGWPVTPHIGGGIGVAEVTRNLSNIFGGTHDTVAVFAYQAIAGFRYLVTPSLAFDVDYRYFATNGANFTSTTADVIKSDYGSHNVVASLTWLFGAPPAP
jgi:opacity protein-like surface antigen